jgi:hypothetical protein
MSATEALRAARDAGISLHVDGDGLVLEASAPPPTSVVELLRHHKAGLVALLQGERDGWSADDWCAFYDERAGIAEFDGGLSRVNAEAGALTCCVVEWLDRNPVRAPSGCCLGCCGGDEAGNPLRPFGVSAPVWLHHGCREAWDATRKEQAVAALSAMGIRQGSIHS